MSSKSEYQLRKESPFPLCTVDIIIEVDKKVALIERKYPPLGWALPGGFVEKGETLEQAAMREAKEETGLDIEALEQFRAYSDPRRDSRFHTISVVFTAKAQGESKAGSDAKNIKLFALTDLPENMAFDHRKIMDDFISRVGKNTPASGGNTGAGLS
jgi:ADP-ribose pyrophosphatase YjhB (NUDIX family)